MILEPTLNANAFPDSLHDLAVANRAGMVAGHLALSRGDIGTVSASAQAGGGRPTVLHFIYGLGGGGAEAMMRSLVHGLDRRRWRVVVVAMQSEPWPEETEALRRAVDALHVLNETALLARPSLSKLRDIMHMERPVVVQTWMHHADFAGGLVARWSGVRQVVWGIHCREITRAPGESRLKAWLFARLMPLVTHWLPSRIVSCSQAALGDHLRMGYARDKMTWIPNGVDVQRFRPLRSARLDLRARLGVGDEVSLIGFVGRFHEMKNLPMLLRAFGLLSARNGLARLVLCGVIRKDLDDECRLLASTLPNPESVLWLPFQSDPENFYPGLDVFTLSSRTEACPMTILEAMACGVPCVTTDVGDCGELIGETGRVVPAGDASGLASAWGEVLGWGIEERERLGVACRARVAERFSLERAVERYQALYETLIPHAEA
jgi:glycosyltransferase involved in cell wall biosynthesis